MKFPNAYTGVKKLFVAELVSIIAALGLFISAVLLALGAAAAAGVLALIAGIALIVAFIIQLVGLYQGGNDEIQIKKAFWFAIVSLILSVVVSVLGRLSGGEALKVVSSILEAGVTGFQVAASYLILAGISTLADKLSNERMARQGKTLATLVIVFFLIKLVFNFYPTFVGSGAPAFFTTLITVTSIIAALVELVVYIITFIYYYKATKMLEK